MGKALLLYEPKSDTAALSYGSWRANLPLANVTSKRLSQKARSSDAALSSTRFRVALTAVQSFRVLVLGPTNFTTGYQYRIRSYSNAGFTSLVNDSGWIKPFDGTSGDALALEWENPDFWLGIVPFDDAERGIFLIHDWGSTVSGQYWQFEIDDQNNPDGFVEISRLFMPTTFAPSINYGYSGNGLSFRDNALRATTLGGGIDVWRRLNPRLMRAAFDYLPEDEGYGEAYRLMRVAGYDGEVFVIPDPDDIDHIQQRSILGRFTTMDALSQAAFGLVGMGFEIEEIIL